MASIFLANAPYFLKERYGKLASVGATLPHLGLLTLGAVLRKAGHCVRIVDASAQGIGYEQILEVGCDFADGLLVELAILEGGEFFDRNPGAGSEGGVVNLQSALGFADNVFEKVFYGDFHGGYH